MYVMQNEKTGLMHTKYTKLFILQCHNVTVVISFMVKKSVANIAKLCTYVIA